MMVTPGDYDCRATQHASDCERLINTVMVGFMPAIRSCFAVMKIVSARDRGTFQAKA